MAGTQQTYPPGTHAVFTQWLHGAGNHIRGDGSSVTHLVVDKAAGDGCTGYLVLAEGAAGQLSDLSFRNADGVPHGIFLWSGSTIVCENVEFAAGSTFTGEGEGIRVHLNKCTIGNGCTVFLSGKGEVQLTDCLGADNLSVAGAASAKLCDADGQEIPPGSVLANRFRHFCEKHNVPGGQVAVVFDNRVVLDEAFGWADIDKDEQMQSSDRIGLHCTWKPVISVAAQILSAEGVLSLDANPMSVLGVDLNTPGVHEWWRLLTLRHCLRHSAGFGFAYDDLVFKPGKQPPGNCGRDFASLPLICDLAAPPGTVHNYSTSTMSLVAIVIEKVLGGSWEDFAGWDYTPGTERASGRFIIDRVLKLTQDILPHPMPYWEGWRKAACYARGGPAEKGRTFAEGTHHVSTLWLRGAENRIVGAGAKKTHLVVDQSAGDKITGYLILAEGASAQLSNVSFQNPDPAVPHAMFLWANSNLVCECVHFLPGGTFTGSGDGIRVQFEGYTFGKGCSVNMDGKSCEVWLSGCTNEPDLMLVGCAKKQGMGVQLKAEPAPLRTDIRKSGDGTSYGASGIYEAPMVCMAAFGAGLHKILAPEKIAEMVTASPSEVGQGLGRNVDAGGAGHGGGSEDEQVTLL